MTNHAEGIVSSRSRATRRDLDVLAGMPGVAAGVRDEQLRLVWCCDLLAKVFGRSRESLLGTALDDMMPGPAAAERVEVMNRVLSSGNPESHFQLCHGRRVMETITPLNAFDFGHAGVLSVLMGVPEEVCVPGTPTRTLETGCLDRLGVLSARELEVLYHVSQGLATSGIARALGRSERTIDNQVLSIHRKLGTESRAALVRLGVERGIHAFNASEWAGIVRRSRAMRPRGTIAEVA